MAYITASSQPISIFATIVAGFKSSIVAMQHGRMLSVLSNMSDSELKRIGITRADIPQYAQKLMARDI